MTGAIDRQFISQFVIMVAVCIGAWIMLVQPRLAELNQLETTLADAEKDASLLDERSIEVMANRIYEVRTRLAEIEARNAFGRDSMLRFRRMMDLADKHSVKISRLDPGTSSAKDKGRLAGAEVVAFSASIEGAYANIADFISELNELDGFIRPVTLNLYPRIIEGRTIVEARFNGEALSFPIPDALLALKGTTDEG